MMGLTDMNAPKCRDLRFQTLESHVSWDAVPTMGHALSGARSTRDVSGDGRSCQVKKLRRKIPRLVRGRVHPECRAKGKLKACDQHRAAACHARAIAATGTTILPCSTVSIVRVGNPRQVMIRRVCAGRRRLMAWSDGWRLRSRRCDITLPGAHGRMRTGGWQGKPVQQECATQADTG